MARSKNKNKKKSRKGTAKFQNQTRHELSKPSSRLLQLPRELRDQIYTHLFTSTRIAFGRRATSRISAKKTIPAPNLLAILYTCRQINSETRLLWLRQVLFSFEEPEYLLDRLSSLPSAIISQIRKIRTGGRPVMLQPIGDDDDTFYRRGSEVTVSEVTSSSNASSRAGFLSVLTNAIFFRLGVSTSSRVSCAICSPVVRFI